MFITVIPIAMMKYIHIEINPVLKSRPIILREIKICYSIDGDQILENFWYLGIGQNCEQ